MKILIDSNISIDIALERQPFFQQSDLVFSLIEEGRIEGYVSAATYGTLYYIIRKNKGDRTARRFLNRLSSICHIATVDDAVIRMALSLDFRDFEDAIQYSVAVINHLEAIATRNPDDFTRVSLPIFTPDRLRQEFAENE